MGVAIALSCLFPCEGKGQFFDESAVWEGTDSIGREVVLYVSPEGRFYSRYPLLTYPTGNGHGVWSIDSTDGMIRFRSLSGEVRTLQVDLISRRYTLAKGQEGAIVLTAGDTEHRLTLKQTDDTPDFLPEEIIEYSIEVPKNIFYDPSDPVGHGLNLNSWTPHGVVFSDSTGAEISLEGVDRELFRVQRNKAAGHTLVYLAQPLQAKADQSGYEVSIVSQTSLTKRPIVAASTERFLIRVNPVDSVVGGLPPIFALPPIFLGPEPDAPLKIRFFGANNYTFLVEDSVDLANWKTVEGLDGEGEMVEWIDSRNNRPSALYYRIRLTSKELALAGVFDFSGGKPLDSGSKLAQDLAKTVLARLNIDGRYVTGTTVESVVRLLPPIFGPQYLVELRGNNEQQQPVSVYAELAEAGVQKTHFVTKLNVDDRWEMLRREESIELDDGLALAPNSSNADRSTTSAEFALADLNERTGKNWSLVEVISSNQTGAAMDHLVLSLETSEGETATVFVEVGMDFEINQSEVLTAFTQSELGVTVIPIESGTPPESGDAAAPYVITEQVELSLVKPDSLLAKRLAGFVLGQERATKVGLKLNRIVAVTQAKATDSTSYFVELLATTKTGETMLAQAHVNELNDEKLGLLSLGITAGD